MIIFKIIGILVVGFFVLIFFAALIGQFWLKNKFKKIIEQAKQNSPHNPQSQPIDIEPEAFLSLVKRSHADLSDSVDTLRKEVSGLGFTEFNVYEIPEMPFSAILASYRKDGLFAVIYDSNDTAHYDLIAKSSQGNIFTISNSEKDFRALSGNHVYKKQLPIRNDFSEALEFLRNEKTEDLYILQQEDFEGLLLQSYQA